MLCAAPASRALAAARSTRSPRRLAPTVLCCSGAVPGGSGGSGGGRARGPGPRPRPRQQCKGYTAPGGRQGVSAAEQLPKQLRDLQRHPIPGVSAAPRDDDMLVWDVVLAGPADTAYAGGCFRVELRFPAGFPGQQPAAYFQTKIWHPNVAEADGRVCVSFGGAVSSVRCVLCGLLMLLRSPNPLSPLNGDAAAQLQHERTAFERQAAEWTRAHAV